MRVVISDKAKSDLIRIYLYLEERSLNAATAFAQRIDSNFANLVRFPFIGRERAWLGRGIRCLVVGRHLVFYTVELEQVAIVRVIDARMDVDEEFYR
jgi:toxin ParE1/3/4